MTTTIIQNRQYDNHEVEINEAYDRIEDKGNIITNITHMVSGDRRYITFIDHYPKQEEREPHKDDYNGPLTPVPGSIY